MTTSMAIPRRPGRGRAKTADFLAMRAPRCYHTPTVGREERAGRRPLVVRDASAGREGSTMNRRNRCHPGKGASAPRYPGTFLLAFREAAAGMNWQVRRWLGGAVECLDAEGHAQV